MLGEASWHADCVVRQMVRRLPMQTRILGVFIGIFGIAACSSSDEAGTTATDGSAAGGVSGTGGFAGSSGHGQGGSSASGGLGVAGFAGARDGGVAATSGSGGNDSGGSVESGGFAGATSCDDVRKLRALAASGCQRDGDCTVLADGMCFVTSAVSGPFCPDVGNKSSPNVDEYLNALPGSRRSGCFASIIDCPWRMQGATCPDHPGTPQCRTNADGSSSCVWVPSCTVIGQSLSFMESLLSDCRYSQKCVAVPDCLCGLQPLADPESPYTATFSAMMDDFRSANCAATYCGTSQGSCPSPTQGTPTCRATEGLGGPPTYQCVVTSN